MNSESVFAEEIEANISNNLRKFREKLKLSKASVAKEINTTRSNITRWEKGTTPSINWLVRLADLYFVSVDQLVGGEEVKNEEEYIQPLDKSKKKVKSTDIYVLDANKEGEIRKEENSSNIVNVKKMLARGDIAIIVRN